MLKELIKQSVTVSLKNKVYLNYFIIISPLDSKTIINQTLNNFKVINQSKLSENEKQNTYPLCIIIL